MVLFFFWFKQNVLWCFVFCFWQCKGPLFEIFTEIILKIDINFECNMAFSIWTGWFENVKWEPEKENLEIWNTERNWWGLEGPEGKTVMMT